MKSVTTKISESAVIITVEASGASVSFELPYTVVHPRTAVQIAGIIASDPYVMPKEDEKAN